MQAETIIDIASKLTCGPPDAAVGFARMVAEHCAQLVEEFDPAPACQRAASHIRTEFHIVEAGGASIAAQTLPAAS